MTDSAMRAIVDTRQQIQRERIRFGARIDALHRGADNGGGHQLTVVGHYYKRFMELEEEMDRDIAGIVKDYPIFHYVSSVKGIGPILSAKLIAMIDISRSPTVSALWRYAGYAVIDGERERPVKGQKLSYNKTLKTTVYLVGDSFLKSRSPYRDIYDKAVEFYQANRPEWTEGHCKRAARRKMVKRFLSHLWEVWRQLEGLPVREPYVHEYLGHTSYESPQEYGWPVVGSLEIEK